MYYPRVLTVQDISCVGQCSLTVALPVISACGVETSVLPSSVLSTHTTGFHGFTFRDLSDDMPAICSHWKQEGITFDAVYTGYLGSEQQIDHVLSIFDTCAKDGARLIVDPAMADHGKLYPAFDMNFVSAMARLAARADYLLPNLTEAAFLTGLPYKEQYDRSYIDSLLSALTGLGSKCIVLTGVSYEPGKTGVVVYECGSYSYYCHEMLPNGSHGTGDIYASVFTGALIRGKSAIEAASVAADFTVECIRTTAEIPGHWYGAAFEPNLGKLIARLEM